MQTKICNVCKIEKNISDFYKSKGGKFDVRGNCKPCAEQLRKKYQEKNKVRLKEYSKSYYDKNQELLKIKSKNFWKKIQSNPEISKQRALEAKNRKLKTNFGISLEKYNEILKSQNDVCVICGKKEITIDSRTKQRQALSVDHNHQTGKIRGLLCGKCNKMIGLAEDNIELLQKSIEYLKNNEE